MDLFITLMILICLTSIPYAQICEVPEVDDNNYDKYDANLDCFLSLFWTEGYNMYLSWSIDNNILNMTVKTNNPGYFAIGFVPVEKDLIMEDADAIIGSMEKSNNRVRAFKLSNIRGTFRDNILTTQQLANDEKDLNYLLTASMEITDGMKSMSFSRKMDTGNDNDVKLTPRRNGILFAQHTEEQIIWHNVQKATVIDFHYNEIEFFLDHEKLVSSPFIVFFGFLGFVLIFGLLISQFCQTGCCSNLLIHQRIGLPPKQNECCHHHRVRCLTLDCYAQTKSLTWSEFLAIVIYVIGCLGITIIFFLNEYTVLSPGTYFAKMTGWMMALSLMMNLIPVTKNSVLIYIFGIPFNRAIKFHRFLSRISLIFGILHFGSVVTIYGLTIIYSLKTKQIHDGLFGFSAFSLMLVMALISTIRRKFWELFILSHKLYIGVIVLQLMHVDRLENYIFILVPVGLLLIDKIIFLYFTYGKHRAVIVKMIPVQRITVLELQLKSKQPFNFRAGGYCFICIPKIGGIIEWHPFSISSGPGEKKFTFHIKACGQNSFTSKMYTWAASEFSERSDDDPMRTSTHPPILPSVYIDGPYGKLSMNLENYRTVILCGAGIGITPLASILADLHSKRNAKYNNIDKVVLIWVIRNSEFVIWFNDLFEKIRDEQDDEEKANRRGGGNRFQVRIYNTKKTGEAQHPLAEWDEEDEEIGDDILGAVFGVRLQEEHDMEILEKEQIQQQRGLIDMSGRPNYRELFEEITGATKRPNEVAVVTCGPKGVCSTAEYEATRMGFHFHKESFFL